MGTLPSYIHKEQEIKRQKHNPPCIMASANFSPLKKCFFVAIFCVALLVLNSGHADAETAPCETLVYQGPCSDYADCNQHCITTGMSCGGLCKPPGENAPNACLCKA